MQAIVELAQMIAEAEAKAEVAERNMAARAYLRRATRIGKRIAFAIGCGAVLAGWFLLWYAVGVGLLG